MGIGFKFNACYHPGLASIVLHKFSSYIHQESNTITVAISDMYIYVHVVVQCEEPDAHRAENYFF